MCVCVCLYKRVCVCVCRGVCKDLDYPPILLSPIFLEQNDCPRFFGDSENGAEGGIGMKIFLFFLRKIRTYVGKKLTFSPGSGKILTLFRR